jgi:hypothetical protein
MQWLQYPDQSGGDNINNAKREASRNFRNETREYLKAILMNLKLTER